MGYTPPWINLVQAAGKWTLYPPGVGTDDFYIYPNTVDVRPAIILYGAGNFDLYTATAYPIRVYDNATNVAQWVYEAANNQYKIISMVDAKDLYLATTGTGVLKFGTHTGSGDVVCNGSIAIKDAAGNARKLMTTA